MPPNHFSQSGPLSPKGPKGCISTVVQMGAVPKMALLCWPQLLLPPGSLHHGCPGGPGAVWWDQNLLSRHPVKRAAHTGDSLHKAREQGRTRFPTGQHPGPQAFQQAHGRSHWEAEACGWAVSSAQSGQSPAEVPS